MLTADVTPADRSIRSASSWSCNADQSNNADRRSSVLGLRLTPHSSRSESGAAFLSDEADNLSIFNSIEWRFASAAGAAATDTDRKSRGHMTDRKARGTGTRVDFEIFDDTPETDSHVSCGVDDADAERARRFRNVSSLCSGCHVREKTNITGDSKSSDEGEQAAKATHP